MKRLVLLIISVFIGVVAYADGIEYFEHVKSLYQQGRYEEAKQGFVSCKTYYSDELNVSSINEWIRLCQSKINERKVAIQAKRQAEIAEAKRKAYEAKQQERIEKKLLYVSSNAFIIDKEYTGMHQAVKADISKNDPKQRFTDNPEDAYWSVYITARIDRQEEAKSAFDPNIIQHYSLVVAYVKIVDNISDVTLYDGEIADVKGGGFNRKVADEYAYKELSKKVGSIIVEQLKSK